MSYDTVATFSQVTSLLMFIAMFIAVVAYAVWPGNRQKFEHVQRAALDLDADNRRNGGRS
jgi:cytochrome c oxidase cbb3-type subunit 4